MDSEQKTRPKIKAVDAYAMIQHEVRIAVRPDGVHIIIGSKQHEVYDYIVPPDVQAEVPEIDWTKNHKINLQVDMHPRWCVTLYGHYLLIDTDTEPMRLMKLQPKSEEEHWTPPVQEPSASSAESHHDPMAATYKPKKQKRKGTKRSSRRC